MVLCAFLGSLLVRWEGTSNQHPQVHSEKASLQVGTPNGAVCISGVANRTVGGNGREPVINVLNYNLGEASLYVGAFGVFVLALSCIWDQQFDGEQGLVNQRPDVRPEKPLSKVVLPSPLHCSF